MAKRKIDLSIIKKPRVKQSENIAKTPDGVPDHNIDGFPVKLDQIDFFEHNPREAENPKYESIKESIRNTGLQNSLVVTKRPNDDHFSLYYGGNTRLQILQELYQETKHKRFYDLKVNYRPFTSISNVIANHMSENENHGDMIFINKAKGATDFKKFYEQENDVVLSVRKLSDALTESGWSISHQMVSFYIYSIEYLLEVIPNCLKAGMGNPKVAELRKYANTLITYAKFIGEDRLTEKQALDEWFGELSESDEPDLFNAEGCFSRTAYRISTRVKKSHTEVEAQLHHILSEGTPYDGKKKYIEVTPVVTPESTAKDELTARPYAAPNGDIDREPDDTKTSLSTDTTEHTAEPAQAKPSAPPKEPQQDAITPDDLTIFELINRIHAIVNRFPRLTDDKLIMATEKPPFFKINENKFQPRKLITEQSLSPLKRDNCQIELYVLFRFLKIWVFYKTYVTEEYTVPEAEDRGLYRVFEHFLMFIPFDDYVPAFTRSVVTLPTKMIGDFKKAGYIDLCHEFSFISNSMEQFFVPRG